MSKTIASGGISQFAPSVAIAGTNIDWSQGNVFTKSISANISLTFSNDTDGRTILLKLTNTAVTNLTITWPGSAVNPDNVLPASSSKIFSIVKIGSVISITGVGV